MAIEKTLLARLAEDAGNALLVMRGKGDTIPIEQNRDGMLVTAADKIAHRLITDRLQKSFPKIAIVSEENEFSENLVALHADERFEVDPLANTFAYMKGLNGWSVNIGQIKHGFPIAGAVYFPARAELYFTSDDGKAYFVKGNSAPAPIAVKPFPVFARAQVAAGFVSASVEHMNGRAYVLHRHPGQYRMMKIADGTHHLTSIQKGYDSWDIAGSHAILRAAGGDIVGKQGEPLRYGPNTIMPDHIGGARDALVKLGITDEARLNPPSPSCPSGGVNRKSEPQPKL